VNSPNPDEITAGPDQADAHCHLYGQTYPGASGYDRDHALAALQAVDLQLAWGLDFHYPRGVLPLTHELVCILAAASRASANALPAVTGRGLECRVVGPHVYTAGIPVPDAAERAERAALAAARVAAYPEKFAELWAAHTDDLDTAYFALRRVDLAASSTHELHRTFEAALRHHARAWQIHFDVMYPMLAVLEVFRTACRAVGIEETASADLISSGDTTIHRTDVAFRRLAESARAVGLAPVFDRAGGLGDAIRAAAGGASWMLDFEDFLATYGERSDSIVDVGAGAWADDPELPLGLIRDLILQEADAPTDIPLSRLEAARRERCAAAAATLPPRDRAVFLRALGAAHAANFAWWNEDHNARIDLRAHLPVGRVAGELATRYGLAREDGNYLFAQEVRGLGDLTGLAGLAQERRAYYAHWRPRRSSLPRLFGVPGTVNDPVLAEIVGVPPVGVDELGGRTLHGLGTSAGVARGRARVVVTPDGLHRVETGDILVCEATSPSWTVVFPRLAACVCDAGGAATHAAIICREYGLPCVSAVGVATRIVKDGDYIEVDGSAGTVTLFGSAS
jgi:pyruvate,water dikinase